MSGRIRSVKPEWLEDEKVGASSDAARILSIGLMLLADDHGRGRAHPLFIASRVWPYGESHEALMKVSSGLEELARIGFVSLYTVGGQRYFEIRNWLKHQKVQHPSAPRVPLPTEGGGEPPTSPSGGDRETGSERAQARGTTNGSTDLQSGTRPVASSVPQLALVKSSGDSHEVLTPDPDLRSRSPIPIIHAASHEDRETAACAAGSGVFALPPRKRPKPPSVDEARIAALESRYPVELVAEVAAVCRRHRKTGRMATSVWLAALESFDAYSAEHAVAGMRIFVDKYSTGSHCEKYLLGIIRKQGESAQRASGWRAPTTVADYAQSATTPAERVRVFGNVTDEDRARVERIGSRKSHG